MADKPQAAVMARPFITGTRIQEQRSYDETKTMTASEQSFPNYNVPTDGFLRGFYLIVDAVTAGNAATVAFTEDAPWNVLSNITFEDTSSTPIIGPMSGWELKTCIKFGGYSFKDDAQDSQTYSITAGAGATGGSFSWTLHVPVEFVRRNGLGALTNKSAASVFKIKMSLAASGTVYGTAPTTLGTVRVRIQQESWMESNGFDAFKNPAAPNPPAVDTIQFWDKQTYVLNAGAVQQQLTQLDGLVRNYLFVLEDSNGSRVQGESDFPDPLRLKYDSVIPIDRYKTAWRREVEENFGYTGTRPTTTANTSAAISSGASFQDNGVYPLAYNTDYGLKNGAENGFGYLPVSSGTRVVFDGTITGSGAHTLTVLVNYVKPAGANPKAITGGK